MPEIGEDNYNMLLEKLKETEAKMEALEKKVGDVVSMNRSLLNSSSAPVIDKDKRKAELGKRLKEAL